MSTIVQPLTENHFDSFIKLIYELAKYEKLDPPSTEAIARLKSDVFGEKPRFNAVLAFNELHQAIGYAIFFETYSSFLARPTVYLEDLFVLESERRKGAGKSLFDYVHQYGMSHGCGRMEWQVLDWNQLALDFYHQRRAEHLKQWLTYRIEY